MQDKYLFPAIFTIENDGISVELPDLPGCLTCGTTQEEAFEMVKDALSLHLYGMEQDGDDIPAPSKLNELKLDQNQYSVLVQVWMPVFRDQMSNRAIKKTLTIPKWLNDAAEQKHVNFSHILQSALKDYLGIQQQRQ